MKREFNPAEIMGARLIQWMIGLTLLGLIFHLISGPMITSSHYWPGAVSYLMMLMTGLGLIFIWKLGRNKRPVKLQHVLLSSFLLLHLLFAVLYDPLADSAVWVTFLFYPLITGLFLGKRQYALWTLMVIPLYLYFVLQDPALYSPTFRTDFFIHRLLFYLGSGAVGWNVIYLLEQSSLFFHRREIVQEREAAFKFLEGMVPVVAEHSRSSPKEIEGISFWMSRLLRHFPEQKIPEWELRLLSLLHYVSKIKLPDYLFMKGGKLTEIEYGKVKEQTEFSREILKDHPFFQRIHDALSMHHEHLDGSGYPNGRKGDEIPFLARLLLVAESFIALTSSRSYHPAFSIREALCEMEKESGTRYDRRILEALKVELSSENVQDGAFSVRKIVS